MPSPRESDAAWRAHLIRFAVSSLVEGRRESTVTTCVSEREADELFKEIWEAVKPHGHASYAEERCEIRRGGNTYRVIVG